LFFVTSPALAAPDARQVSASLEIGAKRKDTLRAGVVFQKFQTEFESFRPSDLGPPEPHARESLRWWTK
jgi:hypothetical protein